jgi:hypothetical protein
MIRWILVLSLACLASSNAAAQATGRISGTVEDSAGKPVAVARVTLTLAGSSVVYSSTLTSRGGAFVFVALRPLSYDVVVEAENFSKHKLKNVTVHASLDTPLPLIRLAPGNSSPVQERAPGQTLQTATVAVGSTVTSEQQSELPIPRREPLALVETFPGVQDNGRAASIYGQSLAVANVALDGVNVQIGMNAPQALNSISLALYTDQVGEAGMVTGDIDGCGCSQVTFNTPSGRTGFHGSGYWFSSPSGFAAQYWADNSRGTPATTSLNELGAIAGGEIKKNRLFFLLNSEADLDRSTLTRTGSVPTHAPTSQDPLMQRVLNLIPSSTSGLYRGTQQNGSTGSLGLLRLDYLPSARNAFGLTMAGGTSTTSDPTDSSVFGRKPDTTVYALARFFSASWRWSLTGRLTNDIHLGASLPTIEFRNSLRKEFGFIALLNDPILAVSQPMMGMDPEGRSEHLHSYQDTLNWMMNKHTFQFGAWVQQYRLNAYGFNNGLLDSLTVPRYVINNITGGTIGESDQRFNITSSNSGYLSGSTAHSRLSANMLSGYVHDTWRLVPSLSINLGFRYDYLSPANEHTGTAIIPVLHSFAADTVYDQNLTFGFASTDHPLYARDFDNDSPYLGAAWKPLDRLPLAVRGGVSISYMPDALLSNLGIYALRNPFQSFDVSTNRAGAALSIAPQTPIPQLPSTLTLGSLLSFANSYHQEPGTVYAISGDLRTPNVEYWNFGLETRIRGFQLDARYLGNRLNEAARSVNRNQVMLPPAFLAAFQKVRAALLSGNATTGFPVLPGGGLCANLSASNCQPDLHAISLIETGQAGELARWYQAQGYAPDRNAGYYFLGNPLAPEGINLLSKLGTARYDALQLTASRRATNGLNLTASYVFSKVLSNLDDYRQGAIDPYLYLHSPSLEWAPAPFNQKHAFKLTSIWDMPFFRSVHSRTRRILGNWSISSIVIAQSGAPFSLLSGGYLVAPNGQVRQVSGLGTLVSQADSGQNTLATSLTAGQVNQFFGISENPNGTVSYVHAPASAFSEPAPAALGNLQRRMFTGPGAFNINLGMRKLVPLTERNQVEFRADAINLLNNVNWLVGDQTYLGTSSATGMPLFDNNVVQWKSSRSVQFSMRVFF